QDSLVERMVVPGQELLEFGLSALPPDVLIGLDELVEFDRAGLPLLPCHLSPPPAAGCLAFDVLPEANARWCAWNASSAGRSRPPRTPESATPPCAGATPASVPAPRQSPVAERRKRRRPPGLFPGTGRSERPPWSAARPAWPRDEKIPHCGSC